MKFTMKTAMVATVATLGLSLAACDSAAENEMEDNAEEMEDAADMEIENMEETGQITDDQADAMEDNVDDQAEAMEEAADEMDSEPT
ncbi:hypothetical protein HME9302_02536 [Alteripontixanthobacter maritimus]|uniref:Uncharacterized protein n=1 Tax=Alteripontixanthobacter maritimus TaxID=2161824 RepID=A0A369QCM2_9SPHN|nr:hypothetical protein [Alteripontixanthobacter maritimus]RDC61315.1 hypothetical protein HME9302_02536 [Alteripontixanthobacter maritimus]